MPVWAIVLTLVFSGVAALAAIGGAIFHTRQSAKDSGRLEQKVDNLADEMGRHRVMVGECQLAAQCEREMERMGLRLDRHSERLDNHDGDIRELSVKVAELTVAAQAGG